MNYYHVKYFVDAVTHGSIAQAARINFVTHPAISQAVRSLENTLNVKLLSHKKGIFATTPEGDAFYKSAQDWLEKSDELKNSVKNNSGEISGELAMAGPQSLTAEFIAPVIFQLRKDHPQLKMRYSFGEAALVRDLVRRKAVQVGLLLDDNMLGEFDTDDIGKGEFAVISSRPKEKIGQKDLVLTSTEKIEVKDLYQKLKAKKINPPPIFLELVSWSLIRKFVLQGDIHGYLPDYVVKSDLKSGQIYKVETGVKPFAYSVKAIWRKDSYLSPAAIAFLDLICMG